MSNKIVPEVYEKVMVNVIEALRSDFEEFGVEDDVLDSLAQTWRENLFATRVARFENDQGPEDDEQQAATTATAGPSAPQQQQQQIQRYPMNGEDDKDVKPRLAGGAGASGSAGGPTPMRLRGGGPKDRAPGYNPYEDVKPLIEDLDGGDVDASGDLGNLRHYAKYAQAAGDDGSASGEGDSPGSGGGDDEDDEEEESSIVGGGSRGGPGATAGGKLVPNDRGILPGEEEIGSDLDDPDSEDEERDGDDGDEEDEGDGLEEMDLKENVVFCSYDKVQRVKNKWKVVFRDGLVRVGGKEYLFSRCQG